MKSFAEETRAIHTSPMTRRIVQDGTAVDTIVAALYNPPTTELGKAMLEIFTAAYEAGELEQHERPYIAYGNPNSSRWRELVPRAMDRRSRRR